MKLNQRLKHLLAMPSPTYQEQIITKNLRQWAEGHHMEILECEDSLICSLPSAPHKPHLLLVGHTDVVPAYFEPYISEGKMYGSGASDMKGALAVYMALVDAHGLALAEKYNMSLVFYSREEMTPLTENGLYHLLKNFPDFFQTVDLALIGEPTDNTLQLGCVGSLHVKVRVEGIACHSARPWNGENALYNALPLIHNMSQLTPVKHRIFGVDFFDVIQITESRSQAGRTSLPGWWEANINFRYAPVRSEEEAQQELFKQLTDWGIKPSQITVVDSVMAGKVIETEVFTDVCQSLSFPIQAKQAWTDVAQLTSHNIPALNFGPGLTSQAHKDHEYIVLDDLHTHFKALESLLLA